MRIRTLLPRRTFVAGLAILFFLCSWTANTPAQGQAYPGATWDRVASADRIGWSAEKLKLAKDYSATISTAAVVVVVGGEVVDEWGETATKYNIHSIRKSFLSAMYGIHVREGRIDLART